MQGELTARENDLNYKYNNYIETISTRFKTQLAEMAIVHNFELGDEYEIAICKTLRAVLPERFGICRGFVVTADGQKQGDDIIIYARDRFPVLRLIEDEDYSLMQQIPVEAVYAFIEAKHSLILDGKGKQSLHKAASQVAAVKALPREPISIKNAFHPYINFNNLRASKRDVWPNTFNPIFGAIFARQVRVKTGAPPLESAEQIKEAFGGKSIDAEIDLIIAGDDIVLLPFVDDVYTAPFFIDGKSTLILQENRALAFAVGICSLFFALDTIILGNLNWASIVGDSLGLTELP